GGIRGSQSEAECPLGERAAGAGHLPGTADSHQDARPGSHAGGSAPDRIRATAPPGLRSGSASRRAVGTKVLPPTIPTGTMHGFGRDLMGMREDFVYVREPGALTAACQRLAGADVLCVDTEFLRDKTYYPKLCLVQIAAD